MKGPSGVGVVCGQSSNGGELSGSGGIHGRGWGPGRVHPIWEAIRELLVFLRVLNSLC